LLEGISTVNSIAGRGLENLTDKLAMPSVDRTQSTAVLPSQMAQPTSPAELLGRLSIPQQRELIGRVFQRLRAESGYLDSLPPSLLDFLSSGLDTARLPSSITFQDPAQSDTLLPGGAYRSRLSGQITVFKACPKPAELIEALAATGTLPRVFATLQHELTHALQDFESERLWKILGYCSTALVPAGAIAGGMGLTVAGSPFAGALVGAAVASAAVLWIGHRSGLLRWAVGDTRLVQEMHADQAALLVPSSGYSDSDAADFVAYHVGQGLRGGLPLARRAFETIDSLKLLGVTDSEVGQILSKSRLGLGTTAALERRLDEVRDELNLRDDQTFRTRVATARAERTALHEQARGKARSLMIEELQRAAQEDPPAAVTG
jgi:hypothetical protein